MKTVANVVIAPRKSEIKSSNALMPTLAIAILFVGLFFVYSKKAKLAAHAARRRERRSLKQSAARTPPL